MNRGNEIGYSSVLYSATDCAMRDVCQAALYEKRRGGREYFKVGQGGIGVMDLRRLYDSQSDICRLRGVLVARL